MSYTSRRFLNGASIGAIVIGGLLPAAASAEPPVGQCPVSHSTEITRDEAAAMNGLELFDAVNKNGDSIVCFKPYRFKPGGTVIDNSARSHS
jgi:hypothetical protein